MKALPDKLQKKGARKATRKAANVMRDRARARAKQIDDPESAETIWRNIVTQESGRRGKRLGGILMRVGVMGGAATGKEGASRSAARGSQNKGNPGGDTRHWRHLEFGTEDTRAQPFMRPAIEESADAVFTKLVTELSAELDKLSVK